MKSKKELKKPKKKINHFIRYSSLAFEMVAIMALGVFAGYKIDGWLDLSFPIFTLLLMVLAVVAAIYHAIKNFL